MSKRTAETIETQLKIPFFFVAGNLSLDFVNTQVVDNGSPRDLLGDFADFAAWAAQANLLEKSKAQQLTAEWNGRAEAAEFFARALAFRRILREMCRAVVAKKAIGAAAIRAINREIQNQSGSIEIRRTDEGFEKLFRADFRAPAQLLAPIAESAADLLVYGDLAHLKKCGSPECVLYFYDTTKNHSRRWCSMNACGNRAKAAAFYRRKQQKTEN